MKMIIMAIKVALLRVEVATLKTVTIMIERKEDTVND